MVTLAPPAAPAAAQPALGPDAVERAVARLTERHGAGEAGRIRRGVEQVARRWWAEDGDEAAFLAFCDERFLADPAALDAVAGRLERVLEQVHGHLLEVHREVKAPIDLDLGEIGPAEELLANLDLSSHVGEDLFRTKVAFLALLNFPAHTLEERLALGPSWDRAAWARSRMMDHFSERVPAAVRQEWSRAQTSADRYVNSYNIRLDRLVTPEGDRLFPEGLSLISHWGLRDELAAYYADPSPAGLQRQRTILRVMERIVRQEIPQAVIDNPGLLWEPFGNVVLPLAAENAPATDRLARPEPDTRYAHLLEVFHAARKEDPFSPATPTHMDRMFQRNREIPEREIEALFVSVLESPEVSDLAALIGRRLARPLEPFDIWYSGFKPRGRYSEPELDRLVRERFPDITAFQAALPDTLRRLGFAAAKADWIAERIVVEPARGAGHALGAVRRQDRAHLRTRVPRGGMDYKGYNVALHELGHNVEQVFTLHGIDSWWLAGVPNNGFTEAAAFLFQDRDLEVLGLAPPSPETRRAKALATLWNTYEIAGVSLVDMRVWHWMYRHPEATPAELKRAALESAREVWNHWFAPHFGVRDSEVLAIYSHMIVYALYLPDYPLGHVIGFQVAAALERGDFGAEFERIVRQGRLTPDAWMRGAVGEPVSARALLAAARGALAAEA